MKLTNNEINIFLWATPRSLSTALERVLKNSLEIEIMHEPYTNSYYFGKDRISDRYGDFEGSYDDASLNHLNINSSLETIVLHKKRVIKELAFQGQPFVSESLLKNSLHIAITRKPIQVYCSLRKLKHDFCEDELGFSALENVVKRCSKYQPIVPVIDGEEFSKNPEMIMQKTCYFLGINFNSNMLTWDDGKIKNWEEHEVKSQVNWHKNLEKSKGITSLRRDYSKETIDSNYIEMMSRAQKSYDFLMKNNIVSILNERKISSSFS